MPERLFRRFELLVVLIAAVVFLTAIISPPNLMDDVDAVQASIAKTMLQTGDWITAHLDGVKYLEKPPLKWWLIAIFFKLFGIHDYVARLPLALMTILLCWLTFRMGAWAFGARAGFYAGLVLSTCIGLFLFTRVLIVDAQLTLLIALAIWSVLRALDQDEPHPRRWALVFWASLAVGVLFKGLIGALFPLAAAFLYLLSTRQLITRSTWSRLLPLWGILLFLLIAAPWHILATLRNPPYFYFGLHSGPGHYHGFLWFYFINEHLLRFLNRRYPHDYNTVPLALFWLLHLVWLFPWSVYLPAVFRLSYRGTDRAFRMRQMAICWIGFVLVFFSFSSTQEYYSLPIYPALALLLGCAMASLRSVRVASDWVLAAVCSVAAAAILFLLIHAWRLPAPGDISNVLTTSQPSSYTLSLGHMGDLALASFAYLRLPLAVAFAAFVLGVAGLLVWTCSRRFYAIAAMMILFFQAARLAMIGFDPYLSSRALAEAFRAAPPGQLIVDDQYYVFSSIFYYANTTALLHNGRVNNLEYGSNAPDAPNVFINGAALGRLWQQSMRCYLLLEKVALPEVEKTIGVDKFRLVKESGGKLLIANLPDGKVPNE